MSIQQDVLDTIGSSGIAVESLLGAMGNIGASELQVTVNALSRARRIQIVEGHYQIISTTRRLGDMPHTGRPPSAEVEAAASLLPATRVCVTCYGPPQALCEFRLVGPGNARSPECNTCHGKKTRAGMAKKRGQIAIPNTPMGASAVSPRTPHETSSPEAADCASGLARNLSVNGSGGEALSGDSEQGSPSAAVFIQQLESPQERGDNRDVSTERHQNAAAVPDTSRSYSRSDPREDARTPASADIASPHVDVPIPFKAGTALPVSTDDVLARVRAQRQTNLNKITVIQVQIQNLQSEVADQERFIELYERFAHE
jgi:hypothetical protein